MLKWIVFGMMCVSLVGMVLTMMVVIQKLGPILHFFLQW